ncbi:MAG: hypothetical protein ACH36H_02200 [Candidatus Nanopelagicales bacterium]
MIIFTEPPTAPAFGSGTATKDRSEPEHLPPLPEGDAEADSDADADSDAELDADPDADPDADELPVGVADPDGEPDGRGDALGEGLAGAVVGEDPPDGHNRKRAMITNSTPPITRARRRQ